MPELSQPALIALFIAAAGVIWWAGIHLSNAVDRLDADFGWGQALGGMVLLAIATNLPELAIVVSAAHNGRMDVAVGNILGGIAIQTLVLSLLDAWGNRDSRPLSTLAASPSLMLEGLLVIAVLALVIVGHFMPASLIVWHLTPAPVLIAVVWLATLLLLRRMRSDTASSKFSTKSSKGSKKRGTGKALALFVLTAGLTLAAGVALEHSGSALARIWGMEGALFGATVLALATSLPEIATGMSAVRAKHYTLAASDILGGNAFLPVLFLLATLLGGTAVLPLAKATDLYLTGLGIVLTTIFIGGMVVKSKKKWGGMGVDAWLMLGAYVLGMAVLLLIGR